jgi:hypothetical protein
VRMAPAANVSGSAPRLPQAGQEMFVGINTHEGGGCGTVARGGLTCPQPSPPRRGNPELKRVVGCTSPLVGVRFPGKNPDSPRTSPNLAPSELNPATGFASVG